MNFPPVSATLGVWLATDNYSGRGDNRTISATELLKSTRQVVLARRVDPAIATLSINSLISSRIGTAIHDAIERSWISDTAEKALETLGLPAKRYVVNPVGPVADGFIAVRLEQRVERKVGDWTITGQYDIVIDGQLYDVKTTKAFVIEKRLHDKKWAMQGSIYKWLNPEVITDDSVVIECVVLDWNAAGTRASEHYPAAPWVSVRLKLTEPGDVDAFIRQKLNEITRYENSPESELPRCTDEDLWREAPRYAYYANPEATGRSTKNFDTLQEANAFLAQKGKGRVEIRPGEVKACSYCPAAPLCTQRLEYLSE